MSKYFVRYSYDVTNKVQRGDGLGWDYETEKVTDCCVCEISEERIDISEVRDYILSYEVNYLGDRKPDAYDIDILVLNKL